LQKVQVARQEFIRGKTPLQILFSGNPGFIRSTHPTVQSIRSALERTPAPVVEKAKQVVAETKEKAALPYAQISPPTMPAPRVTTRELINMPIYVQRAAQQAEPTDVFSTLARGFARVTGAKPRPPAGYRWLY